jgi:hypothetical protein
LKQLNGKRKINKNEKGSQNNFNTLALSSIGYKFLLSISGAWAKCCGLATWQASGWKGKGSERW